MDVVVLGEIYRLSEVPPMTDLTVLANCFLPDESSIFLGAEFRFFL